MALEISMTGTGSVGDIAPGWSVGESGTSLTIGERAAGTGIVMFNAKANDDSLLTINNVSTATFDGLGVIQGVVQSVNQTGINCSITQSTYLDTFNAEVSIPPITVGGPLAWFSALGVALDFKTNAERPDYRQPLYSGNSFYNYWKTGQATYGFPLDNNPMDNTDTYSIDDIFKHSRRGYPFGYDYGFSYSNNNLAGSLGWDETRTEPFLPYFDVTGYIDEFGNETIGNYVFQIATIVNSNTDIILYVKVGSAESAPSYSNVFGMTINGTTDTATIFDLETETTRTVNLSSLNHSEPIVISFNVTYRSSNLFPTPFSYNTLNVSAKDSTNTTASATGTFPEIIVEWGGANLYVAGDYINSDNISYVNFFHTKTQANASPTIVYHEPQAVNYGYNIDASGYTQIYNGAYPATSGIAWELIQDLAAAENFEVYTAGNTLYLRDVGSQVLDITNRSQVTINPISTLSGSKINIAYNNAEFINGVVYDAQSDGNNLISVEAGATTITSVKWDINPVSLVQPTRYLATGTGTGATFTGPLPDGTYFVSDSTGLPISANQWEDYGASVTVNIDPDDNAAIQIMVKGPNSEIPSTTGPYTLEASDGENTFAALKIIGSGVYAGDSQLHLITGIDTDKYSRTTVNTINNPFVITEENAYDRGIWASMKASGPVVSVNFNVPVTSIDGIGLTCGSLFNYMDSTYRVISCSIGNLSVLINAERYVTVADINSIWGALTVAEFDAVWGSLECQDQIVFPYKVA